MKTLKPQEVKSIEQFFQLKQPSLLKVMRQYLMTKYKVVYSTKEYLVAVGDIPVAIVAHLDTVFTTPPNRIFYDKEKNVMWSPDGLGADDRAGVYSIVQLIKRGLKPTVIFTTDEELGAIGAEKLIQDFPNPIADLKYIIQLDRRGSNDCVFYDCDSEKFEEYVEKFGFVTNFGSFSDISVICPAWKIAGVNLSIGYYDEHSYSETLYIGQMLSTIKKVENMLNDVDNIEPFEYIELEYAKYYDKYNGKYKYAYGYSCYPTEDDYDWDPSYGVSQSLWKSWHKDTKSMVHCHRCQITDYDYNVFPTKTENGGTIFLCSDCLCKESRVNWCKICNEPFMVKSTDDINETIICYDCIKQGQQEENAIMEEKNNNDINNKN